MKLVVQIPCYNEEATLPEVLEDVPRRIDGVAVVEVLVIDDGSDDRTADLARSFGADRVISLSENRGLAAAFSRGISEALDMGADIIVNTDGDHQYRGESIADIAQPVLRGEADIVIGDRRIRSIPHFSSWKKLLQRLGSWVVRWASGTSVVDATSGFRAFSREAALKLMVHSNYTYTLDTIIQAGKKGLKIVSVPVDVNPVTRKSRLIQSTPRYVLRSSVTILRIFLMYEALRVFTLISLLPLGLSIGLFVRYAYYFAIGEGAGHVQSVIVASFLALLSLQVFLLGLLADLIARNRRILEELAYLVNRASRDTRIPTSVASNSERN